MIQRSSQGAAEGVGPRTREETPSWGMRLMGFLKHSRPLYQLGILLIFCGVRYGIVRPILQQAGLPDPLRLASFCAALLGTMLMAAAGFLINDYFDRRHDARDADRGTPVGRYFTRRQLIIAHLAITAVALLLVGVVSLQVRRVGFVLLYLGAAGLLWFYSTLYKYRSWLSALLLALMALALPLLAFFFHLAAIDRTLWTAVMAERINLVIPLRFTLLYGGSLALLCLVYAHVKELWAYVANIFVAEDSLCMRYGRARGQRMVVGLLIGALVAYAVLFVALLTARSVGFLGVAKLFTLSYLALGVLLPWVVAITVVAMGQQASQLRAARGILRLVAMSIALYPLANWLYFQWMYA